jgi:hypothetical protein
MRKRIFLLIASLIIVIGLFGALEAYGLETNWPVAPGGLELDDDSTLLAFVDYCYRWGILFGGLAAFVALIIGGFKYLTSIGDPNKMREAREWIISALVGLILIIFSFVILNTLNPDLTTLTTPTTQVGNLAYGGWQAPNWDKPCEWAELYMKKNYDASGGMIRIPGSYGAPPTAYNIGSCIDTGSSWWIFSFYSTPIKSIKVEGACQVNLYQEAGCHGDFDAIAKSNANLAWLSQDHFYSVKVVDISPPRAPEVENVGSGAPTITPGTSTYQIQLTGRVTDTKKNDKVDLYMELGTDPQFPSEIWWPEDQEDRISVYKNGGSASYTVKNLATSTTYYWRTIGVGSGGLQGHSATSTFTIP